MKSYFASTAAAVLLGAPAILAIQSLPAAGQTASSQAELKTVVFDVENMTCATCPITVRRAMEGVAGVQDVTIDYEAKTATAHFDPAKTTVRDIATASTEAGYPAQTQFSGTDL